jgi:hypothetical protein
MEIGTPHADDGLLPDVVFATYARGPGEGKVASADQMTMVREALTSISILIDSAEQEFERSIAELRGQREKLRRDYAQLLKAELIRVDANGGRPNGDRPVLRDSSAPDGDTILAVLDGAREGLTTARIRELAGISRTVPFKSMSRLMNQLVDGGRVVREGRGSGTRYRIR